MAIQDLIIVLFSVTSSVLITTWSTNKKIKAEQQKLREQMLIDLESGNYRTLYEKKLTALKSIKEIQFIILESNSERYDSIVMYMNDFPFNELLKSMHNLIIEYSYLFNEEIVDSLKGIYHDTDFTNNNYDPESSDWLNFPDRISEKFHKLVALVIDNLKIDLKSIEKKIIEPSP